MKRNLLSLALLSIMATGITAEASEVSFTYADGALAGWGKGKKETIDVAMCINEPSLAGMKLTGFKAYINTSEGIIDPSLWLSSNLTLENKENVPDIASFDVTPSNARVGEYDLSELSIVLPEPYLITNAPLYLGYTITVDDNTTEAQKNPIVISNGVNPNGFFLHMQKSVLKWMEYSQNVGGVAYIVATIEGDFPNNSLGFKSYNPIYTQDGEPFEAAFTVSNIGVNAVKSLKYSYSFDDEATVIEESIDLVSPVEPSLTGSSLLSLPFEGVSGLGNHELNVTITEVNGVKNESNSAEISCVVDVLPFVPVHRPLVEEYTGLWCGWCPRGFIAMEMLAEDYGDNQVSICYHNSSNGGSNDPMQVTSVYPMNVTGFPSASVDRQAIIDPYYGSSNDVEYGIAVDVEKAMDQIAIADINVTAELADGIVSVNSSTSFIYDYETANYQVGYILVCNGLTDPSWLQTNYYSGQGASYIGSPLEVLTTWPSAVPGLIYNDVAVDVSGMNGVAGSLPQEINAVEAYNHTYSFNIEGNELVQNPDNLVVTAFIVDKSNGRIVNANKCKISGSSKVSNLDNEKVVASDYFDLNGKKIANPANGIFVKVDRLSDGSVKTSKVMLTK